MATLWRPDWPPETASDYDDEFSNASLAAAWTELDNDSVLTIAEEASGLRLTSSGATWGAAGIYRAMPAGVDWTAWTKISLDSVDAVSTIMAGLFLAQDLAANPTTADLADIGLRYETTNFYQIWSANWAAYNTGSWDAGGFTRVVDTLAPSHLYLRLRYTLATENYITDWSTDGIGWQQLRSTNLLNAAHIGLYISNNTGSARSATFQFFRVVTGAGSLTDVMNGRRVDLENPPAEPPAYRTPRAPAYYFQ